MEIVECYMADAWRKVLKEIILKNKLISDERDTQTMELQNVTIRVNRPMSSLIPEEYPFKEGALEEYKQQLLNPDKGDFVYTYGNRLRKHFEETLWDDLYSIDQIGCAIARLESCPETRRATCVTWDPKVDINENDVPCMIMLDFKIRGGKLYTTGVWRSHDMYGAYPANFFALKETAKYVANSIEDVDVGPIITHSISAHIYKNDLQKARSIFKRRE